MPSLILIWTQQVRESKSTVLAFFGGTNIEVSVGCCNEKTA